MPPTNLAVRPTHLADLRKMSAEGALHAVVDACNDPEAFARMQQLVTQDAARCLFRGGDPEAAAAAPFVTRVDAGLLDWVAKERWTAPWGILVVAHSDLRTLQRHFRGLLLVQGLENEPWYFRYYDPRVLRQFLPTCTNAEIAELYGPCLALGVTDPDSAEARLFVKE